MDGSWLSPMDGSSLSALYVHQVTSLESHASPRLGRESVFTPKARLDGSKGGKLSRNCASL